MKVFTDIVLPILMGVCIFGLAVYAYQDLLGRIHVLEAQLEHAINGSARYNTPNSVPPVMQMPGDADAPEMDPDYWKYWLINSGAHPLAKQQVQDVADALGLLDD